MTGAELPAQLNAISVGKTNVEHCHVGIRSRDSIERFLDTAGFTDNLEVSLSLEHVAHPATNDLVVIDQKNAQRHEEILPQPRVRSRSETDRRVT
jgi:hypothetical protein